MPQGFFASLGRFAAEHCTALKIAAAPRYSICRKRGAQNNRTPPESGEFFMTERMGLVTAGRQDRRPAALARRAELRPAARRLAAVAVGFAGGWAVLYGELMPFGLGFVLGFAEDCFAPCAAGAALGMLLARVWRTLAAQRLYAVRIGRCSGGTVDGSQKAGPGCAGGLRNSGRNGAVLCLWRRRNGADALQCGRCPAGCSHRVLSAAVRARKAGCRDASGRGCGGSGAGQCAAVAAAAGGHCLARHWSCTCAVRRRSKRPLAASAVLGQPCAPQTLPSALRRRPCLWPRRRSRAGSPGGGWSGRRPRRAAA